MRKILKRLCTVACIAALAMPTNMQPVGATEAYTEEIQSATITVPSISNVEDVSKYEMAEGTLTESMPTQTYNLVVKRGMLNMAVIIPTTSTAYASLEIRDSKGAMVSSTYMSSTSNVGEISKFLEAGTYTCTVIRKDSTVGDMGYKIATNTIDGSKTGTIKINQEYVGYSKENVYKKVKITKSGLLSVKLCSRVNLSSTNIYGSYVTLCDSNKKAISKKVYTNSSKGYMVSFGVKKGTYYIKISDNTNCYNLVSTFKAYALGTTSKKKAKKLTTKKKNYVLAASKKKDTNWYKIKLNKARKMHLQVGYAGNESVKMTVYKGKKVVYTATLWNGDGRDVVMKNFLSGKQVKWTAGTYYVKVQKNQKTDSGVVTVKYK